MMIRQSMRRPRIHCSIDVLFHAGVLVITRAVGLSRGKERMLREAARMMDAQTVPATGRKRWNPETNAVEAC